tara:strand:- start:5044 stop:5253 length:210 start_codon:yes stop_codon:yes gene_type:complete
MSKTGAWVMELEEQFWDKCAEFVKSNETVMEATADAVQYNSESLYLNLDENDIEEGISEMWNDYWSKYQ